jgi:hypothetical protein
MLLILTKPILFLHGAQIMNLLVIQFSQTPYYFTCGPSVFLSRKFTQDLSKLVVKPLKLNGDFCQIKYTLPVSTPELPMTHSSMHFDISNFGPYSTQAVKLKILERHVNRVMMMMMIIIIIIIIMF